MLPNPDQMMTCIMIDGEIADGAKGLAISDTEDGAWQRLLEPCQDWSIRKARDAGYTVHKCAIMVINPNAKEQS